MLVTDAGHLVADRDQLLLGLLPVTAGDHLLDLLHLGAGGQGDLIVAHLLGRSEQHRAQTVKGVTRTGAGHDCAEPADGEHGCRRSADHTEPTPVARSGGDRSGRQFPGAGPLLRQAGVQGGDGLWLGNESGFRWPAVLITPASEHRGQRRVGLIGRLDGQTAGQGVDETVAAVDVLERRLLIASEIRHIRVPLRRSRT